VAEQRRIGFHWHLRRVMAAHNLWKSTELRPLLRSRGINLSAESPRVKSNSASNRLLAQMEHTSCRMSSQLLHRELRALFAGLVNSPVSVAVWQES
jgi:hypothetical protein